MRRWFDVVMGVVGVLGTLVAFVMCFTVALVGPSNVSESVRDGITAFLMLCMATFIAFALHRLLTGYPGTSSSR